ncbi:tudor domain-containing protein 7A isoform X3 [Xiphias gladius]|uniref:tudor domain-containing protein 7A isoform X3 n=1 Tax=Xiphias gladius TaxID=8245 RepID=UPI001A9A09F8|nr:tudor domain-containing protein 7A isoform X3 [Xiphias gladius]
MTKKHNALETQECVLTRMSDSESIKKMLRSVLQSSKAGVSVTSLQSEYRSLCGESIPLKRLGYSKLEDYLRSVPSVVRLEHRMGELKCFAAVCQETAHIAELVAKQKSSKKAGCSQVVNCRMRFKPSNPYMLNVRPRSSLRQPSAGGASNWSANRSRPHGGYRGFSASGDYRQLDQRLSPITPVEHRQPAPQPALKQCVMPDRKEKSLANWQKPREEPPEQASRPDQSQSSLYDVELVQSRIIRLLEKYSSGLWMSKISEVYSEMFGQTVHPQVLIDLEKWTYICMVEQPSCTNRADQLVYPAFLPKSAIVPRSSTNNSTSASPTKSSAITTPISSRPSTPEELFTHADSSPVPKPRVSPKNPLAKPTFIFPPQPVTASSGRMLSSITLRSPVHNIGPASQLPPYSNLAVNANSACKDNHNLTTTTNNRNTQLLAPTWTCADSTNASAVASSLHPGPDILPLLKVTFSPTSDSAPFSKSSAFVVSAEVRQRIKELLSKYSNGLWAHALPKLFMDTYKTPFPEHVLDNLSLLMDVCSVEYPMPHDKKKAILYKSSRADTEATDSQESQQCTSHPLPSGLEVLGPAIPPCLVLPSEQYPSVLITDAKNSNAVTIRYVGENYSNAQEAMEDAMRSFYSPCYSHRLLSNPVVGQLVAVRGEDGDELARAQVMEVMAPNKVKVNVTYQDVCVTNVCADGIIYCQLPSRGTARLRRLLGKAEAFFISQMTSESLVCRPFNGKLCLSRYKGKLSRVEVTNMYSNRVMEILFIDLGIQATVEVTDLREIPPVFCKDFTIIPPQAIKCCLADLKVIEGDWSPEAVLWVKEAVLGSDDCKIKILRLGQHKGDQLVYMYLFLGTDSQRLDNSINHQLAESELWQKLTTQNNNTKTSSKTSLDTGLSALWEKLTLNSSVPNPVVKVSTQPCHGAEDSSLLDMTTKTSRQPLPMPPPLQLPQPGQNMDVFVPVAFHPGYFVLQPWQDLHKLVVLMGEMILYYNQTWTTNRTPHIQKGDVCAARIDKNWHRIQVKGVLANGLVSVYELDHGKHELVRSNLIKPLLEEFRQLPFQAITAQLAGVTQHQWSEESSMLFRNHVEKRALVAQVESVQQASEVKGELWECRLTVYLVDTSLEDRDLWIHSIMANIGGELSSAA